MRRLLLLRHAKSSWDDASLPDHDRPLAARGRKAADRMAGYLRSNAPGVDLVLCSSALRTTETLQHVGRAFGIAEMVVEDGLYGASDEELLQRLRAVPNDMDGVAVIGHNPGVHDLATALAGRGDDLDRIRTKFPTGALAVLEFDGVWAGLTEGGASLVAFVTPKDLA
jgi:phosphohistidine phosphatase